MKRLEDGAASASFDSHDPQPNHSNVFEIAPGFGVTSKPRESKPVMEIKEVVEGASIPLSFKPRTPLGEKLLELRAKIVASGERLFDWEELEKEVADRRGGQE